MKLAKLDDVVDDKKLDAIGKVRAIRLAHVLAEAEVDLATYREVINRLYNMTVDEKAIHLRADELPGRHFPKGTPVSIPSQGYNIGNLDDAAWVDGALVVVVDSKIIAPLPHSTTVLVWPKGEFIEAVEIDLTYDEATETHISETPFGRAEVTTQRFGIRTNSRMLAVDLHRDREKYRNRLVRIEDGSIPRSIGTGVFTDAWKLASAHTLLVIDGRTVHCRDEWVVRVEDPKVTRCELRDRRGKQCVVVNALSYDHVHIFERS